MNTKEIVRLTQAIKMVCESGNFNNKERLIITIRLINEMLSLLEEADKD